MHSAIISPDHLAALYRFALLLTGDVQSAESIVLDVLAEFSSRAAQIRSIKSRNALLISNIRKRSLAPAPAYPGDARAWLAGQEDADFGLSLESLAYVSSFSSLPEPGRSALALFYTDLFPPSETAALLQLTLEELGDALDAARSELQHSILAIESPHRAIGESGS